MVNKVDDIVRVLSDEGQSSNEEGHPEDRGIVPEGVCWRCVARPVDAGHDLCLACRSFLLGDTDVDPIGVRAVGDQPAHVDDDLQLGQSSFITDLFDETSHELMPHPVHDLLVELHGGFSDGTCTRVHADRDGNPPHELFTPIGMDHGAMRTERYLLDDESGPTVWSYEIDPLDDGT